MARNYEALYIINPQLEDEAIKGIVERFKNLVESQAQLVSIDEWGKRKLAYPIEKINEGYYVLMEFSAEPDFPQELERVFRITDGVMKYLIVKQE
ncbi:MAG: 30S ribosomal protein S6 [Clostridiaceae bacterium]|nr:30S ribosomal protein S6 [Clostridiaceae bacterium]